MKNSHLLLISPALVATHQGIDAYLIKGRQLRSAAAHSVIRRAASWLGRGIVKTAIAIRAAVIHRRQRRLAIRELRGLNDHTLRDIGLSRTEIREVVDGLFRLSRHETASEAHSITPVIHGIGHRFGKVATVQTTACNDATTVKVAQA